MSSGSSNGLTGPLGPIKPATATPKARGYTALSDKARFFPALEW